MNLKQFYLVENECYKRGIKMNPVGFMLHSTGANNPTLKRYVPNFDGTIGDNQYGNHWNQFNPDGRRVCVHGFIGKLADGSIATVQTLPWDMKGWHAGGSANNNYIGIEMCEDDLTDADYFNKVYNEAVEVVAMLTKKFGWNPDICIIDHSEGHKKGIASNHGDVGYWFSKQGKTMNTFRSDVKAKLGNNQNGSIPAANNSTYDFKTFVKEVQAAIGAKVDGIPGPETLSKTVTVSATLNRRHAVVKPIQKYLYFLGYTEVGTADGITGSKFDKAVKRYQKEVVGFKNPDGEITAKNKTWKKLLKLA